MPPQRDSNNLLPTIAMRPSNDLLSRLINWFSHCGADQAPISRPQEQQDLFSRLMNRISG